MEADANSWMILLRTVGALGLVIGLIFAISFIAKKYLRPERWAAGAGASLRVQSSFSIDPKKKLVVVEVEGQRILLGVAESSISYLCSLSSQASVESEKEGIRHVAL